MANVNSKDTVLQKKGAPVVSTWPISICEIVLCKFCFMPLLNCTVRGLVLGCSVVPQIASLPDCLLAGFLLLKVHAPSQKWGLSRCA